MTIRSSSSLRTELLLRRQQQRLRLAARDGREPSMDEPFHYFAYQRAQRHIAALVRDMAAVGPELDVTLEGMGVYRNSASFRRMTNLMEPLGQALRFTARDIFRLYGEELVPGVSIDELAEPAFSGALQNGAFGIRVSRAPVNEQATLFNDEALFDRSVSRFVDVFRVARDEADAAPIIDAVRGLRTFALGGYKKLANVMSLSASTTTLRWQGDEVVAVTPTIAEMVDEALSTVSTSEDVVTVSGILTGSDMRDERFHLIVQGADGKEKHYRGGVEADVLPMLSSITPDTAVRAVVAIVFTESEMLTKPRESYVLRSLRPVTQQA